MHHPYIDEYSHLESHIHKLDARAKIISLAAFIICVVSVADNSWIAYAAFGLLVALIIGLSRIPVAFILRRSLVVVPFVVLMSLFMLFMPGGGWKFANILVKSYLAILASIVLINSTPFNGLLHGLEKLRTPRVMILIISFMVRYIFVLQDELMRMQQAKEARSCQVAWGGNISALANMLGVLFIRTYERAENVYWAMCARGFSGHIPILRDSRLGIKDWIFLTAQALALAAIVYLLH